MVRDYRPVVRAVTAKVQPDMDDWRLMQLVVDALWEAFSTPAGRVSWVGFYLPGQRGRELFLGPRRDKPACSPIGLQGVCGQAFASGEAIVVDDVRTLGENYIACDPRDRSEVVVPLVGDNGQCRAVLDLDSHEEGAFDEADVEGLAEVLAAAGLVEAHG